MDTELEWEDIDKAKNQGFIVYDQSIVTYKQNKLGLSAYYDKRCLLTDGVYKKPLEFLSLNKCHVKTFLYMGVPKRSQS